MRSLIVKRSLYPFNFNTIQLVFSFSSRLSAMVYVCCPSSSTLIENVVVTCTIDPPSSAVRTIAVFSKENEEASTEVTNNRSVQPLNVMVDCNGEVNVSKCTIFSKFLPNVFQGAVKHSDNLKETKCGINMSYEQNYHAQDNDGFRFFEI